LDLEEMEIEKEQIAIVLALKDMGYEKEDLDEWLEENEDGMIKDFVGKKHEKEFRRLAEYHYKRLN
jgi:shikimate kinase